MYTLFTWSDYASEYAFNRWHNLTRTNLSKCICILCAFEWVYQLLSYYMSGGLVMVCTLFMYAIRKPIINYYFNKLRFHSVRVNMFLWWSMSNQANVYIQQRRRRKKNQLTLTVQYVRLLQFVRVKHWSYLEIEKLVRFCLIFPLTFTSVDV